MAVVSLPHGRWRDGVHERDAEIRPLTGADEAFLIEGGASLAPAERTTSLLARTMTRLGSESVDEDTVRSLTVGDREALLLHLRRLTLGDRLQAVIDCPREECREQLEVELSVEDLLVTPAIEPQEWYERTLTEGDAERRVRFRLPTGADQEAVFALVADDFDAAVRLVLMRCVDQDDEVSVELAKPVEDAMADLDPQADIVLELRCPACGGAFTAPLDVAEFLRSELVPRPDEVYREVQLLASRCHWNEADILALSGPRRRAYCAAVTELGRSDRGA